MVTKIDASMFDAQGKEIILDADADTSITADTDDQIDIKIAGADDFRFTANNFNVLSGSTLTVDSGATITNSGTATGFGVALANDGDNRVVTGTGSGGLNGEANLSFDGTTLAITGTVEPSGDTSAGDNAAMGYTAAEGLILTVQGSTNDVNIKNDADADVLEIPTGTTNVTVVGDVTVGGRVNGFITDQFHVTGGTQSDVTGDGTAYTILFTSSEIYDAGGVFTSPNYTASVAGKAHLSFQVQLGPYASNHTRMLVKIITSNREYTSDDVNPYTWTNGASTYNRWCGNFICDMDASDTAYLYFYCAGGAKVLDTGTGNDCMFMGFLIKV